jgi:hypothetical protein
MKPNCFLSAISIGFLSGFWGLLSPVQAQNPDIAGTPESRLETMKAQLNLSAEQMEKLKPLVEEESAKI